MIVVGIGASAGGLEALLPFVAKLSTDNRMCYIIAQHQPAHHRSLLRELLSRETTLPVCWVEDGEKPVVDTIYVVPQNNVLSLKQGRFNLNPATSEELPKTSIDYFFAGLAVAYQDKAIGIVFSGNGCDGAEGLKAIKDAGGITIAQRPETAKYDGMPKAAIARTEVDLTVAPEEAALTLKAIAEKLSHRQAAENPITIRPIVDDILKVTGMDFVNYKISTLTRQIHRRMAVLQFDTFDSYCHYSQNHPEELERLAQNFLVGVTAFFRDEHCFDALRKALTELVKSKKYGDEIRIWVPGCATGEEAYTIAMLLADELGPEIDRYRVQIYGTDINADAIKTARKGTYSGIAVAGLEKRQRQQYFIVKDQRYLVSDRLRQLVIFSRQDLIRNPPFIRLDLISCRNLLIYLNQTLQEQILKIFHYALVNNGILLLGQAESLWSLNDAFVQWDRNSKLFRKNNALTIRPDLHSKSLTNLNLSRIDHEEVPEHEINKTLGEGKLVELFAPPSVLVTREGRILQFYNDCKAFVRLKPGRADFNLFAIIKPELKTELKAFCHHALSSKKTVVSPPISLHAEERSQACRLRVTPIESLPFQQGPEELLLISFEALTRKPDIASSDEEANSRLTDLEHELKTARETLQTVTEALEVSVGEWRAQSEETQTYNEELQSTNEELETSNEELQSINEELSLVNNELTLKTQELEETNDDLRNILDSIEKAVIVVDGQLRVTRCNDASKRLLGEAGDGGRSPGLDALASTFSCFGLSEDIRQVCRSQQNRRYQLTKADRHYELVIYPYSSRRNGREAGAVLTLRDVTDQFLADQQIQLSASVFETANEAIVITDKDNLILTVNPAFSRITGYSKEEAIGKNPKILNSGQQTEAFYQAMWQDLKTRGKWQGQIWNQRKNGETYVEWLSINALKDDNGDIMRYVGIFSDISESFKAQQTIMRQANYDSLTRLPNRNLFCDRLQQAIVKAERNEQLFAVLFIDLDGFKEINDALGHSLGDRVLQQVAERMVKVARASDTFARFGGDEFIVLISDMESEADVIPATEKILDAIKKPIAINGHELNVTASIGISIFPNDGSDLETLMKHADNAMFSAKSDGRNAYRFFTPAMHERVKWQHCIANDIKNAVQHGQFTVCYQPVYDLESKRIVGAEALLRWQHPLRGFISPEQFIPIAESLNLISIIGEWVLAQACSFIAELNKSLTDKLSIAVNFSSLQFAQERCSENWLAIIRASGIDLQDVVIEITESLMMGPQDRYLRHLQLLRDNGIQIALDDFGTGFSSLSYLKNLPLDILKIDKSFIRDILEDPSDASLVESILAIAENFSLDVIAEGVEEKGQAEFLIARQCRYAQGYFFGKPVTQEQFKRLVTDATAVVGDR